MKLSEIFNTAFIVLYFESSESVRFLRMTLIKSLLVFCCVLPGLKVSLGTDVAGGYSMSMLDAMRLSIAASKALRFHRHDMVTQRHAQPQPQEAEKKADDVQEPEPALLTPEEAFHLATMGGRFHQCDVNQLSFISAPTIVSLQTKAFQHYSSWSDSCKRFVCPLCCRC
jgi:hypothetical protein